MSKCLQKISSSEKYLYHILNGKMCTCFVMSGTPYRKLLQVLAPTFWHNQLTTTHEQNSSKIEVSPETGISGHNFSPETWECFFLPQPRPNQYLLWCCKNIGLLCPLPPHFPRQDGVWPSHSSHRGTMKLIKLRINLQSAEAKRQEINQCKQCWHEGRSDLRHDVPHKHGHPQPDACRIKLK